MRVGSATPPTFLAMFDSVWFNSDESYSHLHTWPPSYFAIPDCIQLIVTKILLIL